MKKLIVFLVAVGFLVSCSSTKVVTDRAKDADFSSYETVKIEYHQTENGKQQINAFNVKRIENALQHETKARGLSESENADIKVLWGVDVNFQKSYTTHSTYHGHGGYYGGFMYGSVYSDTMAHKTATGILRIAIIDTASEEVIWLGAASDALKGLEKNPEETINQIVAKVFEEFPIAKSQS